MKKYDLGFVLSGGGARAIAHLGMIKALREMGVEASIYSGASGGAIAGAFMCAGYEEEETLSHIIESKMLSYFRPAMSWRGFLKLEKVVEILEKFLPATFEELTVPLKITTTNFTRGESEVFSSGPLHMPIIASSSIPVIFEPVKIGDSFHVDGGVMSNLPVQPIAEECNRLIGMHCNPISNEFDVEKGTVKAIMERSLLMAININSRAMKEFIDLYLEPPKLDQYKVFDVKKGKEIFDVGYSYAKTNQQSIENQLVEKGILK